MVTLNEQEKQVVNIINKLPPDRRRLVLYELAKDVEEAWRRNTAYAESQLRGLAAKRGLDWERMDDQQRQDFIADLIDEDH